MRVQIVKQHRITKDNYITAGYFDGSLEEKAKKDGDTVVKSLIDKGLVGSSVTCVLIGKETYTRRWVDYEIFKSIEVGMGVFGVRIHQLADAGRVDEPMEGKDEAGTNPFKFLGYGSQGDKLIPMIHYESGWKDAPMLKPITEAAAPYLSGTDKPVLSSLFQVYDWVDNNGYENFASWVEKAAKQAGR